MCDRHFKDINPNMEIKEITTSDNVSAVASNDGLCGPLTISVKTVRKALEFWLHAHVFKDDVKIKNMTFKTDGQVEITFKHLSSKPT